MGLVMDLVAGDSREILLAVAVDDLAAFEDPARFPAHLSFGGAIDPTWLDLFSQAVRAVTGRDHVRAEPRTPDLDQRGVLPGGRLGSLDTRVDREERGAGHAVLEARPRGTTEGIRAEWQSLSSAWTLRR